MKGCNKCREVKPLDDFYRDRHAPDGHRYSCKDCDNRRDSEADRIETRRQYGLSEAGKAAYRRYRATEKGQAATERHQTSLVEQDYRHSESARQSRLRYNNSDKGRTTLRAKWASPQRKEWRVAWYARPEVHERVNEQLRLACHKRNAAIRSLPKAFTLEDWDRCLNAFESRCAYCGANGKLLHEHFIPLTAGGPYTPANIVPACRSCNSAKKDRLPEDWCSPDTYHRILSYFATLPS